MKARVISTYLDKELGQYVYPGSEVDLPSNELERLAAKGCVEKVQSKKPKLKRDE